MERYRLRDPVVQTFLPYPSFQRCARVLDPRRLGKQRVETLQILRALEIEDYGWKSHPVVHMWRGHTEALVAYGAAMVEEWSRRGFGDTCLGQITEFAPAARSQGELAGAGALPSWLGRRALHRSHQSALVQKDPAYYRARFPRVPADLPYVWPEPDHAPPAPAPFSAWIVRAASPAVLERFQRRGIATLPRIELGARPTSKAARQVRAFVEEARPGDPIAALLGDALLAGEITGPSKTRGDEHVRAVRWLGPFPRSTLAIPARMQDPRLFFAMRGERDPRQLARKSA